MIRETEAEQAAMSFGVSGRRIAEMTSGFTEESKESVVGRRDLFRIDNELANDVRIKKHQKRQAIVKQKASMLAKLQEGQIDGFGADFNIAGT